MRRPLPLVSAALALPLLAGCTAGGGAPAHVVVRDGVLRVDGASCSGARPYEAVHRGADLALVDESGDVVASDELGSGEAVPADDKDYGVAPRIPSFCVFDLSGLEVPGAGVYDVLLDGHELTRIEVGADADDLRISIPALGTAELD
ncbi:hypothetical protein [Agromyces seonyuensis]|uniref:Secreted protein n=1 Tax=Agromyces seonyuensis TaxID=2662446 RepID=A0A6I4NXV5_9MICO|nr:hypothetical protein [Agromyces seonyuensis]MWB99011.1 hypothetical protein [Agromyces seonyuensis]